MQPVTPVTYSLRSPLYRLQQDAVYVEREGRAVVHVFDHETAPDLSETCALLDLSPLARSGLRGSSTEAVLNQSNLPFPDRPNHACLAETGVWVARLGATECWVLDNIRAPAWTASEFEHVVSETPDCYPLYCQHTHAWFALTGPSLPAVMAKVCGVDLRPASFAEGAVVQTSVARVNAIVVHQHVAETPVFSLFCDVSYAAYLWQALMDAMQEFGGVAAGLDALG